MQPSTGTTPSFLSLHHLPINMSTTPSVDQTVQRDQLPPDQADTPGSPHTLHTEGPNENEVAKDGFTSPSGADTLDATAEILALSSSLSLSPSTLHLSDSSSSSPQTSSNEDSPREASSPDSSNYDFDSSDEEEILTSERSEDRFKKKVSTAVTDEEHETVRSDDENDKNVTTE